MTSPNVPLSAPQIVPNEVESPGIFASVREAVVDVWEHRDLLVQLAVRDIKLRYKQAVMGAAWAVFMPLLIVLSGLIIRLAMAKISGSSVTGVEIANIAVKGLGWAFFVGALGFATASLVGNSNLVTKIYFPREVLPIAACIAQSFDSAIGLLAVAVVLPFLGVSPSLQLLWVPILLVLLWALSAAAALFLSCANLFFRDVKYMVQVFLSFGIFFTPVLVDAPMFGPRFAPIIMLNPVSPILEGLRLAVVDHHNLIQPVLSRPGDWVSWHPWYLAYSAAWAIVGLVASALFFHRSERRFALYV